MNDLQRGKIFKIDLTNLKSFLILHTNVIFIVCVSFQPVNQWSSANVVEWMAALNLYRYAEVFKSKDIKGSDLMNLDKEKLMVGDWLKVDLLLC